LRGGPGCPSDCDVEFIVSKALHLSLDEKSGDLRRETGQFAVRGKRNPLYLSMMIADESHVPKEAPKIDSIGIPQHSHCQRQQLNTVFKGTLRGTVQPGTGWFNIPQEVS
jgi:hypothetical protein